jgi:hypothetical protein
VRLSPDTIDRLARTQAGVVTSEQLTELGADHAWISRVVRSGQWQRLHHGVLLTHSGPVLWRTRAWAGLLYAGPGATLSHETAATLHEFRAAPQPWVDVTVPEGRRVGPSLGVVVHRRSTPPPAGGRPPRTWRGDTVVDLVAAASSDDDAVGWVCDAVRAGTNLLEIAEALARRSRMRNSGLLRDLLHEVAEGIESPLERRYHRDVERRHGLPRADLQVREVVGGVWIRADCVYRGLGVRVELDGALAHPGGRTDGDTWRDNAVLIEHGEITLRYRWRHVAATSCETAAQVAAALWSRGWTGRPGPCGPGCAVGVFLPGEVGR